MNLPNDKRENTEPESELRKLESEIRSLLQSDGDPAQLWKLREKWDLHYLRLLNPALAQYRRTQESVRGLIEVQESGLRTLEVALTRTDLTIPELLLLEKTFTRLLNQKRRSLVAQKKAIERRLHIGNRHCANG